LKKTSKMQKEGIVLFDGVCNFCNESVQFIIKRDPKGYFKFAALQSEDGQALLKKYNLPIETIDTIVLIENKKAYTLSTVPLRITRKLYRLWSLLYIFVLVPSFIRDPIYRWIARNRYKWFGKKETCMMPTPEIRNRFL
jgi:predicted DCC family thiol-disulfide oxidoreductase YuxK